MSPASQRDRVLVVLMAQTRAWQLTGEAFFRNVLDELRADLALCVEAGEDPNPLYARAKHRWLVHESGDWGRDYDEAAGSSAWRVLLPVGEHMLGGIEDSDHPQAGSAAILYYYRWFLHRSLERTGILRNYDWIVLTRSDLLWPVPHPDVRHLSDRHIYVLDGEQYGGVCDRHFVVPRRHFDAVLSLVDPIFTDPESLRRRIDRVSARQGWSLVNIERLLALRLRQLGVWRRVRYLPYVPYAVRAPEGPATWSLGDFDEELGYHVKYPGEKARSEIAQCFISDQGSWERHLAPVRGALQRRRLREAYRRRGLYERAFRRRDPVVRVLRRVADATSSIRLQAEARAHERATRAGRVLRRLPGLPRILDARLRRIRRRAERSAD